MEKQMHESLSKLKDGNRIIKYITSLETDNMLLTRERDALADDNEMKCELNHELQKQVHKLAETLADVSDCTTCEKACPIGNPLDCNCECFDANVWKEWAEETTPIKCGDLVTFKSYLNNKAVLRYIKQAASNGADSMYDQVRSEFKETAFYQFFDKKHIVMATYHDWCCIAPENHLDSRVGWINQCYLKKVSGSEADD